MIQSIWFFIFALGVGITTAHSTDIPGPGPLAFGATYLAGWLLDKLFTVESDES